MKRLPSLNEEWRREATSTVPDEGAAPQLYRSTNARFCSFSAQRRTLLNLMSDRGASNPKRRDAKCVSGDRLTLEVSDRQNLVTASNAHRLNAARSWRVPKTSRIKKCTVAGRCEVQWISNPVRRGDPRRCEGVSLCGFRLGSRAGGRRFGGRCRLRVVDVRILCTSDHLINAEANR